MAVKIAEKLSLEDIKDYESALVRLNWEYCKKNRCENCPLDIILSFHFRQVSFLNCFKYHDHPSSDCFISASVDPFYLAVEPFEELLGNVDEDSFEFFSRLGCLQGTGILAGLSL